MVVAVRLRRDGGRRRLRVVGRRDGEEAGGAESRRQERAVERLSELRAHRAEEDEVDAVVGERQYVDEVAERRVDLVVEVRQDAAEQVEHALRELGEQEEHNDGKQHARRPVRLPLAPVARALLPAAQAHVAAPLLRHLHRVDEHQAEDGERDARTQLDEHRLHPEVECRDELLGRRARLDVDGVHARGAAVGGVRGDARRPLVVLVDDAQRAEVRDADDDGGDADGGDGDAGAPHAAQRHAAARVSHKDVAEDGERDGQPDGDGVHDDAEAGVGEQEADGAVIVARRGGARAEQDVEVDGERKVGGHREAVRDGERRQQVVGGRQHVAARQHDDVQHVGDDAERAHDDGDEAVARPVGARELDEAMRARVAQRRRVVVEPRILHQGRHAAAAVTRRRSRRPAPRVGAD